jgi:hypothetical protein
MALRSLCRLRLVILAAVLASPAEADPRTIQQKLDRELQDVRDLRLVILDAVLTSPEVADSRTIQQKLDRELQDVRDCVSAWFKSWSSACKRREVNMEQSSQEIKVLADEASALDAMNAAVPAEILVRAIRARPNSVCASRG